MTTVTLATLLQIIVGLCSNSCTIAVEDIQVVTAEKMKQTRIFYSVRENKGTRAGELKVMWSCGETRCWVKIVPHK